MSINFEKLLNTNSLKNIVKDLKEASKRLGIDFFGVGALARNVWYLENNELPRGTKDVDFGVYLPNQHVFQSLKNILIAEYEYYPVSDNAFSLISPYEQLPVDLLPFGEIEEQGKVIVEGKGLIAINHDGFSEVRRKGLLEIQIEEILVTVCSIPSVVLLKLIAYDDRPENRPQDPLDLNSIFKYYPDIESERIWGEYSFLYEDEKSHDEVGITVLGYEISRIISESPDLVKRTIKILEKGIQLESKLAEKMIENSINETVASKRELLNFLKNGIMAGFKNYES